MADDDLESMVARYLAERDVDPRLSPGDFAARHPERTSELRAAIDSALTVLRLLPEADRSDPRAIGPYQVVRRIGHGGMGVVYEVERDGRRHALKYLPSVFLRGSRSLERFRREVHTLSRISHPHIIQIVDSGTDRDIPYFVMELVEGETLDRHAGRVGPREIAQWMKTLADAVQVAHDRGVIHRDLKPQNVMLRTDRTPVLLDFGLVHAEELPTLTSTGDLLGTPGYLAPEVARGGVGDARSDVYGLGLIAYELVVGLPAFGGETRETVIDAVSRGRFLRPGTLEPGIPEDLERVVLQALTLKPEDRYGTARELSADFDRFLSGHPVAASPLGQLAGKPEPTVDDIERALRSRPDSVELWRCCVRAQLAHGNLSGAQEALSNAERLADPGDLGNLTLRGQVLAAEGLHPQAIELLEQVLARDPASPTARRQRALSLDSEHRIAEAALEYEKHLGVRGDDAAILVCLANLRTGADRGRCRRCDEVFARDPELMDLGEAQELLIRAVEARCDDDSRIVDNLLYVAQKLPRRSDLISALEKTIAVEEKSESIRRLDDVLRKLRLWQE